MKEQRSKLSKCHPEIRVRVLIEFHRLAQSHPLIDANVRFEMAKKIVYADCLANSLLTKKLNNL